MRNNVFISYSHADAEHLKRLLVHLRPLERAGKIDVWADTKIKTGQRWRTEIDQALSRAAVAVLLVSADFIASDFIAENELPPLLKREAEKGLKIVPVVLKPCSFTDTDELSQFQAANDPAKPLISLSESDREELWLQIYREIRDSVNGTNAVVAVTSQEVSTASTEIPPLAAAKLPQEFGYDPLLGEEIISPDEISQYLVYQYHHIDFLDFMPNAETYLSHFKPDKREKILHEVKERFRREGWEGDGALQILWLPPFLGAGVEDTFGVVVWFVKQSNNGTAFMASPVPLPFNRLLEQN